VVTFAGELLVGLRRDHGAVWLPGRPRSAAESTFAAACEALAERLAATDDALAGLGDRPPRAALAVLGTLDAAALLAEAQAVDAMARALRAGARPGPPAMRGLPGPTTRGLPGPTGARPAGAPGPGPGGTRPSGAAFATPGGAAPRDAGRPGAGTAGRQPEDRRPAGFAGLLRRWTEPAPVERAATGPAPATGVEAARAKARQAFEAAHRLAREVLAYVSPRLTVLRVALEATGLPGPRTPLDEIKRTLHPAGVAAGIAEPQLAFLPPLVKLFLADGDAVRRVHPALTQWRAVQTMATEADVLRGALRGAPPPRAAELVGAYETGKLRAAIYPLTHLHLTFQGLPIVSELFPVPPAGAAASGGRAPGM
jgi:hypothetical protein